MEEEGRTSTNEGQRQQQRQQQRQRLPPELREAEGLARVRESMEATPWPTLVRLDPRDRTSARAVWEGDSRDGKNVGEAVGKSVEAAGAGGVAAVDKGEQEEGQPSAPSVPSASSTAAGAATVPGWGDGQEDGLEALFDRIRAIRESARQGQGQGPAEAGGAGRGGDEARRARAATAALELARVLGLGADEDEEDSDDVES